MDISNNGIAIIKEFEGLRLSTYADSVGVPTIGYGHTKGVTWGMKITEEQANAWLRQDIKSHTVGIDRHITVPLTQNQYDALASFHFNLGPNILAGSALKNYINAKNWTAAANEMKKYVNAGGRPLPGLIRRRNAEAALFLKGVNSGGATAKPTPQPSKPTTGVSTYTVKSGDNLSTIAARHGLTLTQIANLNPQIKDLNFIKVGQKINIKGKPAAAKPKPKEKIYTVKKSDYSLGLIAERLGVSLDYIVRKNGIKNPNLIYPGQKLKY